LASAQALSKSKMSKKQIDDGDVSGDVKEV